MLFSVTVADVERSLGRRLRVGEAARITAALSKSSIPDAIDTVLSSLTDLDTSEADQQSLAPLTISAPAIAGAEVCVLVHSDRHGDDVSVHVDGPSALAVLAQTVRSRWDNIRGLNGVPPSGDALSDRDAVDIYFEHRDEDYSIQHHTVDAAA